MVRSSKGVYLSTAGSRFVKMEETKSKMRGKVGRAREAGVGGWNKRDLPQKEKILLPLCL